MHNPFDPAATDDPRGDERRRIGRRLAIANQIQLRLRRAIRDLLRLSPNEYEILLVVSAAAVDRGPENLAHLGGLIGTDPRPAPVSKLAIANSTGLNRETVRRTVDHLIERDWLIHEGRGVVIAPTAFARPENQAFWDYCLRQLQRFDQEFNLTESTPTSINNG